MKFNLNSSKGFTLVEIMVVVTIIGILAAVLFANFDDARKQSRDKSRMTSLKEMQLSIELYKAQYGRYPAQGCGTVGVQFAGVGPYSGSGSGDFYGCAAYVTGHDASASFVPDFISSLPIDPKFEVETDKGFYYMTDATGSSYKLMVNDVVEALFVTSADDEFARCPSVAGGCAGGVPATTYAVYGGGSSANW